MEFKFKSTGRDITDVLSEQAEVAENVKAIPVGIVTPLRTSRDGNGIFELSFSMIDQLTDNLRNLVQTNHGERLGRPDYGANLKPLSLEILGQNKFENEAMNRISTSVSKYLPFINLKTMSVRRNRDLETDMPQAIIRLEYSIKKLNKNRIIDVIINLAG